MNIEESIQQIETLIEAWQLDEADLNQTDINAMQVLLKENQELKQKYENAVADYETTMAEKEQLNSLVNSCQEEIRELKKQLEEYKKKLTIATKMEIKEIDKSTFVGIDYFQDKCISYKSQQKEFMKWLESVKFIGIIPIEIVCDKYKEIIGDDK